MKKLIIILCLLSGLTMVRFLAFDVLLGLEIETWSKQSLSFYIILFAGGVCYSIIKNKLFKN